MTTRGKKRSMRETRVRQSLTSESAVLAKADGASASQSVGGATRAHTVVNAYLPPMVESTHVLEPNPTPPSAPKPTPTDSSSTPALVVRTRDEFETEGHYLKHLAAVKNQNQSQKGTQHGKREMGDTTAAPVSSSSTSVDHRGVARHTHPVPVENKAAKLNPRKALTPVPMSDKNTNFKKGMTVLAKDRSTEPWYPGKIISVETNYVKKSGRTGAHVVVKYDEYDTEDNESYDDSEFEEYIQMPKAIAAAAARA